MVKRLLKVIVIVIVILGATPLLVIAGVAINHHYFLGLRQVLASPVGRKQCLFTPQHNEIGTR